MNYYCLPKARQLTETSRYISEVANMPHANNQPYVGARCLCSKGGIHVSALKELPDLRTYLPGAVGNHRRVLVSVYRDLKPALQGPEFDLDVNMYDATSRDFVRSKKWRNEGFQFEGRGLSLSCCCTRPSDSTGSTFSWLTWKIIVEKERITAWPPKPS